MYSATPPGDEGGRFDCYRTLDLLKFSTQGRRALEGVHEGL